MGVLLLAPFTSFYVSWHFCTPHLALDGWVFRLGWLLTCPDKTFFHWAYCICRGGHLLSPSAILYPYFFRSIVQTLTLTFFPFWFSLCTIFDTLTTFTICPSLVTKMETDTGFAWVVALNKYICHMDFAFTSCRTSYIFPCFSFIIFIWVPGLHYLKRANILFNIYFILSRFNFKMNFRKSSWN